MSIIFKNQKSFKCKQILYQKTKNKDDNDTEKYNWTYSVVAQAPLHQNGWHTIDILRYQPNNHQITSGSYQHDNNWISRPVLATRSVCFAYDCTKRYTYWVHNLANNFRKPFWLNLYDWDTIIVDEIYARVNVYLLCKTKFKCNV
jgi:hypothetical protein